MKSYSQKTQAKYNSFKAAGVAGGVTLTMSSMSHAVLPTYASDLFTTLTGYGTDVLAATALLGSIVFGGFWLWSLVRKGANKAK